MADLLTTRELQDLLCVDRKTIYRMLHDGRLPGVRVGGQWRFQRSIIETWLADPTIAQRTQLQSELEPTVDILPLDCFASVQNIFAEAMDVAALTTDLEGNPLIAPTNACAFCDLVLASPEGRARCTASRARLRGDGEALRVERCHAGLTCACSPVRVEGAHLAMVIACQYVTNAVEKENVIAGAPKLAQECSISPDALRAAAKEVRIVNSEHAIKITHLLDKVAETFSKIGHRRLELLSRLRQVAKLAAV